MDPGDGATNDWVLGDFGITPHDEMVWRSLLARPGISRSELALESGLAESQLDSSVEALSSAGLTRAASSPLGVAALDPSVAVEVHIVRAERELADRAKELASVRARLAEFSLLYERGKAAAGELPGFEVVLGLEHVRQQIYLAAEQATAVTRAMLRGMSSAGLRHAERSDRAAVARGVQDLSLIEVANFSDPEVFRFFEEAHARGERVRTLPKVPTQMLLMDESVAVVPVDASNTSLGAIFIRVPSVVSILVEMFDHLWSEANPTFVLENQIDGPVGRGGRVLELLAIGATDERIARTLAIGVRTVRREVADIKVRLGVSSRAEISAAAIRRGWL